MTTCHTAAGQLPGLSLAPATTTFRGETSARTRSTDRASSACPTPSAPPLATAPVGDTVSSGPGPGKSPSNCKHRAFGDRTATFSTVRCTLSTSAWNKMRFENHVFVAGKSAATCVRDARWLSICGLAGCGRITRSMLAFALVLASAACGSNPRYAARWDGRRGYDGNGDYGYDLAASRSEARLYRQHVAAAYPQPGPAQDPWGPYITEAARRFRVPERWIREVMRQESGGRQRGADGGPITSSAGAMGLMQVMPRTYDMLSRRYGLGGDPYDPHDNILAGAAYIREMYAIYGSPGFLAAYNAGPDRVDAYLSGSSPLPDETVNYVASIAPRLGHEVAANGPLAAYADASATPAWGRPRSDLAYAGGDMTEQAYQSASGAGDGGDRAFGGGGPVTPYAPAGVFSRQLIAAPTVSTRTEGLLPEPSPERSVAEVVPKPTPAVIPFGRTPPATGGWAVQVGAFPDPATSEAVIEKALARSGGLLAGAQSTITPVQRDLCTVSRSAGGPVGHESYGRVRQARRAGRVVFHASAGLLIATGEARRNWP